jgi:uncharacterized RDD family membrane protein YckC
MKRAIIRTLFYAATFNFLVMQRNSWVMKIDELTRFLESTLGIILSFGFLASILFFLWAIIYSWIQIIRHKSRPMVLWGVVVLVPIVGAYLYFEKCVFRLPVRAGGEGASPTVPQIKSIEAMTIRAGWRRLLAAIIDYCVIFTLLGIFVSIFGSTEAGSTVRRVNGFEALLLVASVWLIVFPVIESIRSATIGKSIFGLRVVMRSGQDVTFKAALCRHLVDPVDMVFALWLIPFFQGGNDIIVKRLGDRWANTVVLRKKDWNQFVKEHLA